MFRFVLRSGALAAALSLALGAAASAADIAKPTGPVVLRVTGKIKNTNADGAAEFDIAMLEALAGRQASMETPWTQGSVTFEGPLGRALLEMVGADGSTLKVSAINDYSAEVPAEDLLGHDTILATRLDGKPMSVRDKGPLFLIYPFDKEPSLYNEKYFSRSVWQLNRLTVQ